MRGCGRRAGGEGGAGGTGLAGLGPGGDAEWFDGEQDAGGAIASGVNTFEAGVGGEELAGFCCRGEDLGVGEFGVLDLVVEEASVLVGVGLGGGRSAGVGGVGMDGGGRHCGEVWVVYGFLIVWFLIGF